MKYDVIKPNSCPAITMDSAEQLFKEAEQQVVSWLGIERVRALNSIDARILFELPGESGFPKWATIGLTPNLLRQLTISAGRDTSVDMTVGPMWPGFSAGSDRSDLKCTLRVLPMLSPGPKVCLVVNNEGPSRQSMRSESTKAIDLIDLVQAATSPSIGPAVWSGPQLNGLRKEPGLAGMPESKVRLHPMPPEPRAFVHQVHGLVQAESLAWFGAQSDATENQDRPGNRSLQVHKPKDRFHAYIEVAPERVDTCLPVRQATKDSPVASFQNCVVVPFFQEGYRAKTNTIDPFMDFLSEVIASDHPAMESFLLGPARKWTLTQISDSQLVRAEAKGEGLDPGHESVTPGRRRACRL